MLIRKLATAVLLLPYVCPAIAQDSRAVCFSNSSPGAVIPACDDLIETDPGHAQASLSQITVPLWPSIQNIFELTLIVANFMPVRFNGVITLNAIVDSGASDVSVPADLVLTLMRANTITEEDFLGQKT